MSDFDQLFLRSFSGAFDLHSNLQNVITDHNCNYNTDCFPDLMSSDESISGICSSNLINNNNNYYPFGDYLDNDDYGRINSCSVNYNHHRVINNHDPATSASNSFQSTTNPKINMSIGATTPPIVNQEAVISDFPLINQNQRVKQEQSISDYDYAMINDNDEQIRASASGKSINDATTTNSKDSKMGVCRNSQQIQKQGRSYNSKQNYQNVVQGLIRPIIIHTYPPKIIQTKPSEFMTLVQSLTGSEETRSRIQKNRDIQPAASSSSSSSSSIDHARFDKIESKPESIISATNQASATYTPKLNHHTIIKDNHNFTFPDYHSNNPSITSDLLLHNQPCKSPLSSLFSAPSSPCSIISTTDSIDQDHHHHHHHLNSKSPKPNSNDISPRGPLQIHGNHEDFSFYSDDGFLFNANYIFSSDYC